MADFLEALHADVRHGDALKKFLASDTGVLLAEEVEEGLAEVKDKLLQVNPHNVAELCELQIEGRALSILRGWILKVHDCGDEARFELENLNDERGEHE